MLVLIWYKFCSLKFFCDYQIRVFSKLKEIIYKVIWFYIAEAREKKTSSMIISGEKLPKQNKLTKAQAIFRPYFADLFLTTSLAV